MPRAIVIGGARRVGRAVALELARAGFELDLTHLTSAAEARATADEARALGAPSARLHRLDLADLAAVGAFAGGLPPGPVDALVLVASSYARTPFGEISAEACERELRVNAAAPLLLSQSFAPALRASGLPGGGAIVAFGDIHAQGRPRRAYAPYLMSKAAVHSMVEALALELAPGVRVNAIAPGVVAWPEDAPADERARYEARIPLVRPGTPEDAARLVRSLVLDMPYVTGSVLRLDGGRWLR
jgi:pteridine reductase